MPEPIVMPNESHEPALFAEPEHDYNLPGFPPELVKDTTHHNGLRYTYIGDDGEWLVILGRPPRTELDALPMWLDFGSESEPEETYARLLWECPDHKAAPPANENYCRMCSELVPGHWWLDWGVGKDEAPDANKDKAGYFPVVVWEVSV